MANTLKQYLYRIRPTRLAMLAEGPTEREAEIVGQHFDYLKALVEQGIVILAGRTLTTGEESFGIVIFQAETDEAAQKIVDNDPAVKQGVMQASLFPYRVALIREANLSQE